MNWWGHIGLKKKLPKFVLNTCFREQLISMGRKSVWTQNPRVETLRLPTLPDLKTCDGAKWGEPGPEEVRADANTAVDETVDSK